MWLVIFFVGEGRHPDGRYPRLLVVALAAWSNIVTGILITARTGTPTSYEEIVFAPRAFLSCSYLVRRGVCFCRRRWTPAGWRSEAAQLGNEPTGVGV